MKIVLGEGATMPKKANYGDAGYDLFTSENFIVRPGRNVVPTGLKMRIDYGWEGHIRPRSGFSVKGIEAYPVVNGEANFKVAPRRYDASVIQGTIDHGYSNYVGIIVKNHADAPFCIKKGTRLAQIVFEQCYMGELEQVDSLDDATERGTGGFESSGTI